MLTSSSSGFKKGDIVVFRVIVGGSPECTFFNADHLLEVVKVHRSTNHLEIRETMCWHHNRKSWGSNGADIRHATPDEICAKSRLPKKIRFSDENPLGAVVFHSGRDDVLKIKHYTMGNSLELIDAGGKVVTVDITEIRSATPEERVAGTRAAPPAVLEVL